MKIFVISLIAILAISSIGACSAEIRVDCHGSGSLVHKFKFYDFSKDNNMSTLIDHKTIFDNRKIMHIDPSSAIVTFHQVRIEKDTVTGGKSNIYFNIYLNQDVELYARRNEVDYTIYSEGHLWDKRYIEATGTLKKDGAITI